MHCRVFLDSDDLKDLRSLIEHVRQSDVLVLIQTAHVLERPWCLLEILTAIDADVPIVGVTLLGSDAPYDFSDANQLLGDLAAELDRRNPGAAEQVRKFYPDMREAGVKLSTTLPSLISKRVDYSMSKRVLDAMLLDVLDEVNSQAAIKQSQRMLQIKSGGHAVNASASALKLRRLGSGSELDETDEELSLPVPIARQQSAPASLAEASTLRVAGLFDATEPLLAVPYERQRSAPPTITGDDPVQAVFV